MTSPLRLLASVGLLLGVVSLPVSCSCDPAPADESVVLGDGFARIYAPDATTVELELTRAVDEASVRVDAFGIADYTNVPPLVVDVLDVATSGEKALRLSTSPLRTGRTYTLRIEGLRDSVGAPISGTLNFSYGSAGAVREFTFRVTDLTRARAYPDLALAVSVDPDTGAFSERLHLVPLVESDGEMRASMLVEVDSARTIERADDDDTATDRRAYAARLIDGVGRPASALVLFDLPDADAPAELVVPVLPPPEVVAPGPVTEPLPAPPVDTNPGDGLKVIRVVVDDRISVELESPSLRLSFDESGGFDATFPQVVALTRIEGEAPGYWEAVVAVAVDPERTLEGTSETTFPYFAYLVSGETEYESLSLSMVAPDETPETLRLSLGNPDRVPVTFRVDVSGAWVTPDGSVRGLYPGEAVFLTGAWQVAVDALGNNCGDSFSGGESLNLRMRELAGHPGVWTRTLWLPPGRPYGWKALRCDADIGCGPLNQLVSSSGNAFATVMKNLATENLDAFADAEVALIDPISPTATSARGQTYDYSQARVYEGEKLGSEPDPEGTPDGLRMFKQEVPDLVVVVQDTPVKTRIFHVGTWRDVNLGKTPAEVIAESSVVELGPLDYDDFFTGRYPPSREEP